MKSRGSLTIGVKYFLERRVVKKEFDSLRFLETGVLLTFLVMKVSGSLTTGVKYFLKRRMVKKEFDFLRFLKNRGSFSIFWL